MVFEFIKNNKNIPNAIFVIKFGPQMCLYLGGLVTKCVFCNAIQSITLQTKIHSGIFCNFDTFKDYILIYFTGFKTNLIYFSK